MPIRTSCPKCQAQFVLQDELAGQKVRCQQCQQVFMLPAAIPPPVPAPLEVLPVEDPLAGVITPSMAAAHEERRTPVAVPSRPAPPRRPIPPRTQSAARPQAASTSVASIILTLIVVFGCLIIIGGVAIGIFFFVRALDVGQHKEQPVANTRIPPPNRPRPPRSFWLAPYQNGEGEGNEDQPGSGQAVLNFDARDKLKLPGDGPSTVRPDAPVPQLPDAKSLPATRPDGQMAEEVLERAEKATVYLRVTRPEGMGSGTGFFALDDGIIVTNAHVIGMKQGETGKPSLIEAFIYRGKPDERKLTARILAVEPLVDLAILQVQGSNLPPPLKVISSQALKKTQVVYAFGFPGGEQLERQGAGKGVSTTNCKISAVRREHGQITKVQLDGQLNHGNSGGPIIDLYGNVVGVAVEIYLSQALTAGTGISFAVPGDQVHHLYHGRVARMTLGQPERVNDGVKVPVTLQVKDPRKTAKQVGLDWWIGDAGSERPASSVLPQAQEGDTARQQVRVDSKGEKIKADLALPLLPPGKVFWLQPVLVNQKQDTRWGSAVAYQPPAPIEDKQTPLRRTSLTGGKVELTATARLRFGLFGGRAELAPVVNWYLATSEEPQSNIEGRPTVQYQFTDFKLGLTVQDMPAPRDRVMRYWQNREERPGDQPPPANFRLESLSESARRECEGLAPSLVKTLEALDFGPPLGKDVAVGQTWQIERSFPVDPIDPVEVPGVKITCTYVGMRPGKQGGEALVLFEGEAAGVVDTKRPSAKLDGLAWVEAASGQVLSVQATLELDHHLRLDEFAVSLAGSIEYRLRREPTPMRPQSQAGSPESQSK